MVVASKGCQWWSQNLMQTSSFAPGALVHIQAVSRFTRRSLYQRHAYTWVIVALVTTFFSFGLSFCLPTRHKSSFFVRPTTVVWQRLVSVLLRQVGSIFAIALPSFRLMTVGKLVSTPLFSDNRLCTYRIKLPQLRRVLSMPSNSRRSGRSRLA